MTNGINIKEGPGWFPVLIACGLSIEYSTCKGCGAGIDGSSGSLEEYGFFLNILLEQVTGFESWQCVFLEQEEDLLLDLGQDLNPLSKSRVDPGIVVLLS